MITRIHGASSTLAANPRRKHHRRKAAHHSMVANPKKKGRKSARKGHRKGHKRAARSRKVSGWRLVKGKTATKILRARGKLKKVRTRRRTGKIGVALPPALVKKRYAKAYRKQRRKYSVYTRKVKGKRVYRVKKNPALMIAGVPVIEMAIGSVAAIALGQAATILISKYAKGADGKSFLPDFLSNPDTGVAGEIVTAGLAAALYMKGPQNPMVKEVAKFAFIGSVFQAISKLAKEPIKKGLQSVGLTGTSSMGGIYFDPYTAAPAVGGAYLPTTAGTDIGGIYTNVDGLGLFNAPSIYG